MWHIYILKCHDNSFYTGITEDLLSRVKRHNAGKGSEYTKASDIPITVDPLGSSEAAEDFR